MFLTLKSSIHPLICPKEHFYMEPQVSIAVPKRENNEMEIITSIQWPGRAQVFS